MTIKRIDRIYTVDYIMGDVEISVNKDLRAIFIAKVVCDKNGIFDHFVDSELLTVGNNNRGMLGNVVNGFVTHTTLAKVYHRIKQA